VEIAGARIARVPAGLDGRYWARADWTGPVAVVTIDPDIGTGGIARAWPQTDQAFSARWRGVLLVQRAGQYRLSTVSSDQLWLWVDDALIVNNGGVHARREATARVNLTTGAHDLRIDDVHQGTDASFQLLWASGDDPLEPVPTDLLVLRRPSELRLFFNRMFFRGRDMLVAAWGAFAVWTLLTWGIRRPLEAITRSDMAVGTPFPLKAILALTLVLSVAGMWWGLPGPGWAPDELSPPDVLAATAAHFSNGWWSKYPPFHYYVLAVATAPLAVIRSTACCVTSQTVVDTLMSLTLRAVSIGMAVGTVFLTYVCGLHVFDRKSALWGALIFTLISPFLFYAKLANLDVPYLFWFSLSLLAYLRILSRGSRADYILCASAATLAICTKDQAYGLYVLPAVAVIVLTYRRAAGDSPTARFTAVIVDRRVLSALVAAVGLFVLCYNLPWNVVGFTAHVKDVTGPSSDYRIFENTWRGQLSMLSATLWLIRLSLGWPLFLICAIGGGLALSRGSLERGTCLWAILPAISYYVFFIMIVGYNYDRFLLPLLLTLSLFGGFSIRCLLRLAGQYGAVARLALGGLFAYSAVYAVMVDFAMVQDARYGVEQWLHQNADKDASIGTIGGAIYLPRINRYTTISLERRLADLSAFNPDYLVVNADLAMRFVAGTPDYEAYAKLRRSESGYAPVLDSQSWTLFGGGRFNDRFEGVPANVFTNLAKVNPHMLVFARAR
jgi:4-amino-4-deoxy-L-arabinose transferase-like glycosyltransferase